jgi:Protein of unknown function (DUF1553)/Protein of unknown function (DUF1549)
LVLREDPLDWWSLRPLARPAVPAEVRHSWCRTPIDAFVLSRLEHVALEPSPQANRRTLIRRLSFDLLGLPPDPEDVEEFARNDDPLAYEKLVDRLFASPHYGERWARHWLDVVHFGETHGYDKDKPRPHAWPYRDYLIRAFNDDRSYQQFVAEQLAGDVLEPLTRDGVEATGFLAAGPWDFIGHAEVPETKIDGRIARNLDRDDMVTTTLDTFCSLTVQCARCHDHKFDPITQEHYYSLQAVFAAIDRADRSYDVDAAVARRRQELRSQVSELDRQHKPANDPARLRVRTELSKLPPQSVVYSGTVYMGSGAFRGTGPDGGRPREIHVLARGDVRKPGELVGPGTVPIIQDVAWRFELPPNSGEGARRAALVKWIIDRRNPLTWRSIVNRIWLYHFGRGIVDTPSDFGRMGQLPTHPELLDWLATDFRDGGESLKRLHRRIVTSAAYRQVSNSTTGATKDGANTLLWRMNRRRLDAESIRDSVLCCCSRLDERLFGPSFQNFVIEKPEHSPHYEFDQSNPDDPRTHRRTIYRFLTRSQQDPFMSTLDCADPSQIVDKRDESITALQALALLNDRFMVCMAGHLAERIGVRHYDAADQVAAVLRLTLERPTTREETEKLSAFARQFGLAETCRLIFNLNEFVFVD